MGFIPMREDGSRDPDFDPFDNDYIEVVSAYVDYDRAKEDGVNFLHMYEGPKLEICSRERLVSLIGENLASHRSHHICLKNKNEITLYSDLYQDRTRVLAYHILACDRTKRSTCKTRKKIAAFLNRSLFDVMSQ